MRISLPVDLHVTSGEYRYQSMISQAWVTNEDVFCLYLTLLQGKNIQI